MEMQGNTLQHACKAAPCNAHRHAYLFKMKALLDVPGSNLFPEAAHQVSASAPDHLSTHIAVHPHTAGAAMQDWGLEH